MVVGLRLLVAVEMAVQVPLSDVAGFVAILLQ
jgi:hypothetical protein